MSGRGSWFGRRGQQQRRLAPTDTAAGRACRPVQSPIFLPCRGACLDAMTPITTCAPGTCSPRYALKLLLHATLSPCACSPCLTRCPCGSCLTRCPCGPSAPQWDFTSCCSDGSSLGNKYVQLQPYYELAQYESSNICASPQQPHCLLTLHDQIRPLTASSLCFSFPVSPLSSLRLCLQNSAAAFFQQLSSLFTQF